MRINLIAITKPDTLPDSYLGLFEMHGQPIVGQQIVLHGDVWTIERVDNYIRHAEKDPAGLKVPDVRVRKGIPQLDPQRG